MDVDKAETLAGVGGGGGVWAALRFGRGPGRRSGPAPSPGRHRDLGALRVGDEPTGLLMSAIWAPRWASTKARYSACMVGCRARGRNSQDHIEPGSTALRTGCSGRLLSPD